MGPDLKNQASPATKTEESSDPHTKTAKESSSHPQWGLLNGPLLLPHQESALFHAYIDPSDRATHCLLSSSIIDLVGKGFIYKTHKVVHTCQFITVAIGLG